MQPKISSTQESDEDLLTSARTHFRPIKEDGHWADGTTFPINNNYERVSYRRFVHIITVCTSITSFKKKIFVLFLFNFFFFHFRSESGNLLYLPGGESPYMEFRENMSESISIPSNLTIKFRVRQCDKSVQTEPIRSPVKRRILSEHDRMFYSSKDVKEISVCDIEEIEKDSFNLEQVGWDQPIMLLRNERKRYLAYF